MRNSKPEQHDQPNLMRRRLARGGVAGSVILGSLISRPVLGAVPYNCTISGKLSGNTSAHGDAVTCSSLGRSRAYWLGQASWGNVVDKGTLPNPSNCKFTGSLVRGTNFNGFGPGSTLSAAFVNTTSTGNCTVVNGAVGDPATMLQVLNTSEASDIFNLGRATVISILNSLDPARPDYDYPLTVEQVITMFNAVHSGGTIEVVPGEVWNQALVITYFESLYLA